MKTLLITLLLSLSVTVDAKDLVQEVINEMPTWDKKTRARVRKYAPVIIDVAKAIKMSPKLMLSIAWTESHFNPNSVSWAKAYGIMQVKKATAKYAFKKISKKERQRVSNVLIDIMSKHGVSQTIVYNVMAGGLYLKYLLKKFNYDKQKAIIAYNMGPRGTYRLIKKKYKLSRHDYYKKVSKKLLAIN